MRDLWQFKVGQRLVCNDGDNYSPVVEVLDRKTIINRAKQLEPVYEVRSVTTKATWLAGEGELFDE